MGKKNGFSCGRVWTGFDWEEENARIISFWEKYSIEYLFEIIFETEVVVNQEY